MKRYIVWAIVIGVVVIAWAMTWENSTTYVLKQTSSISTEAPEEEEKPMLRKELVPICACESTGNKYKKPTHFDQDGNVLKGKTNPKDIGICQINTFWNGQKAIEMGLDLYQESDNIIFANWLYSQQGSKPWDWSKPCWQ